MALPNFYIPGVQRGGTTWLASMLKQHPEIFIPQKKEIDYFNQADHYAQGKAWYERHFRDSGCAIAIGEATPHYLAVTLGEENAKVVERILALTPDAKFIVSLRNPVTRAVSSLLHEIGQGRLSPWTNLDAEFDLLLAGRHPCQHVLEFGRYSTQIRSFLRHFPIHHFAFIIYEDDIRTKKRDTLRRLCEFLGVRTDFEFQEIEALRNPGIRTRVGMVLSQLPLRKRGRSLGSFIESLGLGKGLTISHDTRQRLYQYYAPGVEELRAMIGRDLDIWQ